MTDARVDALAFRLLEQGLVADVPTARSIAEQALALFVEDIPRARAARPTVERSDVPLCDNCGQPVTDHMRGCRRVTGV